MTANIGIVDTKNNPFASDSWIKQRFSFTPYRQKQLVGLFGKDYTSILGNNNKNESSYVAFVGSRWGFAELRRGILTPTELWENRDQYDGFGKPKLD